MREETEKQRKKVQERVKERGREREITTRLTFSFHNTIFPRDLGFSVAPAEMK